MISSSLIGLKIKELLASRKLSIPEIEKIADIRSGTIRNILKGRSKNPSFDTILRICKALECSLDVFAQESAVGNIDINKEPLLKKFGHNQVDFKLIKKCISLTEECLDEKSKNVKFDQLILLIIDSYLFAINNENKIDSNYVRWNIEKIN